MVTAIVFVQAEVDQVPKVAESIAAIDGVSEVYSVTGALDLVVMVRVKDIDDVASVVTEQLNTVPGVLTTETHIAFRAYSRHDLEAAFSLGME
jgi:DNA-binding Lrp family transcriptional regulator